MVKPKAAAPDYPPEKSESMDTSGDSRDNLVILSRDDSPIRLPPSLVDVKNLARTKKGVVLSSTVKKTFEEKIWKVKSQEHHISEEARHAWEVGKRLGLTSKVSEEVMIWMLEKEDRARVRKDKKAVEQGEIEVDL